MDFKPLVTLLAIVNPLAIVPFFIHYTQGFAAEQRRRTILESRPMRRRPDAGMVRSKWEMSNQHGDVVLEMEGYGMFGRRQGAEAEAS